ncbi:hypothetical protein D3C87_1908490 [compost metagenome]
MGVRQNAADDDDIGLGRVADGLDCVADQVDDGLLKLDALGADGVGFGMQIHTDGHPLG